METRRRTHYLLTGSILYLAVPLVYMLVGDFSERTLLKESLSLLTMAAFFLMLGQFYLSRINTWNLKGHKMSKVIGTHKIIGYVFIPIIVLHPFFIVLPRFFEAGVAPADAFKLMLTNYSGPGIILGISAMALMLILGITSMLRKRLPMKYTTWRTIHGIISMVFIILATWHAVDLGRHTDTFLSIYMITASAIGVLILGKLYIFGKKRTGVQA